VGNLGDLGLAISGQKSWSDPGVILERNSYLGGDRDAAWKAVEVWRLQANTTLS